MPRERNENETNAQEKPARPRDVDDLEARDVLRERGTEVHASAVGDVVELLAEAHEEWQRAGLHDDICELGGASAIAG